MARYFIVCLLWLSNNILATHFGFSLDRESLGLERWSLPTEWNVSHVLFLVGYQGGLLDVVCCSNQLFAHSCLPTDAVHIGLYNFEQPHPSQCCEIQETLVSSTLIGDLENVVTIFVNEDVQRQHGSRRGRGMPRVERGSYEESWTATTASSAPSSASKAGGWSPRAAPTIS